METELHAIRLLLLRLYYDFNASFPFTPLLQKLSDFYFTLNLLYNLKDFGRITEWN